MNLLEAVFNHPQLNAEHAIIERYSRAFPELQSSISQQYERNRSAIRRRLERALFPLQSARRFRFTIGKLQLSQIMPRMIEDFLIELRQTNTQFGKPHSPVKVRRYYNMLNQLRSNC